MLDEEERLEALRGYGVLDTPPERAFDDIVQAAASLCAAPISAVSFVDFDRQWFKAKVGLDAHQTARDISFCTHAMHDPDLYVVPDATAHPLFADNVLVRGDPNIRFYAGAPIRTAQGAPLGTLCVIDSAPRPNGLSEQQAMLLKVLARQVETQLQLRVAMRDLDAVAVQREAAFAETREREAKLLGTFESAEIGWWDWDVAGDRVTANAVLAGMVGLSAELAQGGTTSARFFANVHPADRSWVAAAVAEAVATGAPFREDYRVVAAGGAAMWISARGQCALDAAGRPVRFTGVAIDITSQKASEDALREANLGRDLAMSAARLGRFDHSPARGVRFYDERALEMVGMTQAEIQEQGAVLRHLHPEDRERLAEALAAAVDPNRAGPFRQTYRVIHPKTGDERWISAVGRTQFADGVCTRFTGVFEDVTEATEAELHRRLLTNELNHRVKNTLAVVASLVESSLRGLPEATAARKVIGERIQAFGRAHDLLTADSWHGAAVSEIVDEVVASLSLPSARIAIDGAPVRLGPQPALQLALALNELATNALKYGALSDDAGRLSLAWGADGEGEDATFRFDWREHGGPPVETPTRRGFGTVLMERATAVAFGGAVALDYLREGVRWRLTAPLEGLATSGRSGPELGADGLERV